MYVPLNTVTSIFGMNIQQINDSGHNIWIFAVTSLIALLFTGTMWYLIESINAVKNELRDIFREYAQQGPSAERVRGSKNYSLGLRLRLLTYYIKNSRCAWREKCIVSIRILVNDSKTYYDNPLNVDSSDLPIHQTVCRYVVGACIKKKIIEVKRLSVLSLLRWVYLAGLKNNHFFKRILTTNYKNIIFDLFQPASSVRCNVKTESLDNGMGHWC